MSFHDAFADKITYQYKPFGVVEQRRERIRPAQPFQFPSNQVFLLGKISDDLFVVQFIPLTIEQEDDESYIVSDDIFLVYGNGETRSESMKDYQESLVTYFQIIEEGADANDFDKAQLKKLQSYIQRRGHNAVQAERS